MESHHIATIGNRNAESIRRKATTGKDGFFKKYFIFQSLRLKK
jgi:hypothetical protein